MLPIAATHPILYARRLTLCCIFADRPFGEVERLDCCSDLTYGVGGTCPRHPTECMCVTPERRRKSFFSLESCIVCPITWVFDLTSRATTWDTSSSYTEVNWLSTHPTTLRQWLHKAPAEANVADGMLAFRLSVCMNAVLRDCKYEQLPDLSVHTTLSGQLHGNCPFLQCSLTGPRFLALNIFLNSKFRAHRGFFLGLYLRTQSHVARVMPLRSSALFFPRVLPLLNSTPAPTRIFAPPFPPMNFTN